MDPKDKEIIDEVLNHPERKIWRKAQNYALQRNGYYGNRVLTWKTPEEVKSSSWDGKVCIRDLRGTDRDKGLDCLLPLYNIPILRLDLEVDRLVEKGIPKTALTFNQSMPDDHLLIQGEVCMTDGEYFLTYSRVQKPMRLALLEGLVSTKDLDVRYILKKNLWPASFKELEKCLSFFSVSPAISSVAVEFSSYDVGVGDLPARNTIIWEARNY